MYFCIVSVDLKSVRSDAEDVYNEIKKASIKKYIVLWQFNSFCVCFPICLKGWHFRGAHKEGFLYCGFNVKVELFPYGYVGILFRTPSVLPH